MIHNIFDQRYVYKICSVMISGLVSLYYITAVPEVLGPTQYGILVFSQGVFLQLFALLESGSANHLYATLCRRRTSLVLPSYLILCGLAVLFAGILTGIIIVLDADGALFPLVPTELILLSMFAAFSLWFFQITAKIGDALSQTKMTEVLKASQKLGLGGLIFVCIWVGELNANNTFLILIYTHLVFQVLFFYKIRDQIKIQSSKFTIVKVKKIWSSFYRFSKPLFIYTAVGAGSAYFDIWLLQFFGGADENGLYGFAFMFVAASMLIPASVIPLFIKDIVSEVHIGNLDSADQKIVFFIFVLVFLTQSVAAVIFVYSDWIVHYAAGLDFVGAVPVLAIMSFYPVFQAINQISASLLYSFVDTKFYANVGMLLSALGGFVCYFLVSGFEQPSIGLAIKIIVFQLLTSMILLWRLGCLTKIIPSRIFGGILVGGFLMVLLKLSIFVFFPPHSFVDVLLNIIMYYSVLGSFVFSIIFLRLRLSVGLFFSRVFIRSALG